MVTKEASKNHNLSRDFIKKALRITKKNGYILFIVPNNWMSFSDRNKLPQELTKYQFYSYRYTRSKEMVSPNWIFFYMVFIKKNR